MTNLEPHTPLPVEPTWDEFITLQKGEKVSDLLIKSPTFQNADYIFRTSGVVGELKQLETELSETDAYFRKFNNLQERLVAEKPNWKPLLFGGINDYPKWYWSEYLRIYRTPLARILKKANRQIRETKSYFSLQQPRGILLFVNDGFTGISPLRVIALAASLLQQSYSSIDCFIYLTVNRYVEIPSSEMANLVWAPTYSDRAETFLVDFVDSLGRSWFDFLEQKIGHFTERTNTTDHTLLISSKSITKWSP
jgi:hypothetical protein